MKYYYNENKDLLLIDENDYTPYLADRGYTEITKQEYELISQAQEQEIGSDEEQSQI